MTTTTQHTPGPWKVSDKRDADCSVVTSPTGPVAKTYWTQNVPEMRANAHLIAAAPELLAALKALEGSFEKHRPKTMWDAARAAIAKAEGRS